MSAPQAGRPAADRFSSRGRAFGRLILLAGMSAVLVPVQLLSLLLRLPLVRRLPRLWHRGAARIMGWRIHVHGTPSDAPRTLFVANHASYSDIVVLGSLAEICFIAKAEVATWPVFSQLARLHGTTFIERRGAHAAAQRDELTAQLESGRRLVLFAEGTSNDGIHVRPFKSALFSIVHGKDAPASAVLQPVSIAYTRLDGLPVGRAIRPHFAWYGDMALVPHLLDLLGLGRVTVDVTFHDPVNPADFASRKALAEYCHRIISAGVAAANTGSAAGPGAAPHAANS